MTWFSTGNRNEASLLEQLDEANASVELRLSRLVEVGAELRERFQRAEGREVETERTCDLLHGLDLRVATDSRHRDADVDGGTDALEEQIRGQEDLAVGDGDDVGRDVRRHVAGLGLDDRQRRHRTATELIVHLDRALEQAAVQVEDVTRVGFAARRAAERERHLAVGDGLLGEVVVDQQGGAAGVVLARRLDRRRRCT